MFSDLCVFFHSSNSLNIPILKICVDNMYSWKFGINKSIDDVTGVDDTNYQKRKINQSYDTSKNGLCHHKTVQTLNVEGWNQFIYKKIRVGFGIFSIKM